MGRWGRSNHERALPGLAGDFCAGMCTGMEKIGVYEYETSDRLAAHNRTL